MKNRSLIAIGAIVALGLIGGFLLIPLTQKNHEGACYNLRNWIDKTKDDSFGTQLKLHEPIDLIQDLYSCDCLYSYYKTEKDWLIRRRVVNLIYGMECAKRSDKAIEILGSAIKDANISVSNEARNALQMLKKPVNTMPIQKIK